MADLLDKLTAAVRTGTIGTETRRSAQWFRDKIKGIKGDLRNRFSSTNAAKFYREAEDKVNPNVMKRRANLGDIFCYYYNPKYRNELPYYDMFPMIMLIGTDQDTFTGLNFHYLPPKFRAILLDRVNAKVGKGIINWKKISKIPQVAPTVKRYRFDHIMRKVVPIEENEQEIAIFLPLERFRKASKSSVWADSRRKFA
tara:strand:+ start:569 stop:1162 length:594 start_codon:yes stop_codon:yes gene_type:complete